MSKCVLKATTISWMRCSFLTFDFVEAGFGCSAFFSTASGDARCLEHHCREQCLP